MVETPWRGAFKALSEFYLDEMYPSGYTSCNGYSQTRGVLKIARWPKRYSGKGPRNGQDRKARHVRGVRHKFLTFNHAKNAFKSIKNKNLHRILTRWVWQSCRSVFATMCRCRRGRRRSGRELFSVSWCLRERLAPQAIWWNRRGGLLLRRCLNFTLTICILLDTLLANGYSQNRGILKMARWPHRYSGKGPRNGQDRKARHGKPWRCKSRRLGRFGTTDPLRARLPRLLQTARSELVILLAGGDKGSQSRDIKIALRLAKNLPDSFLS